MSDRATRALERKEGLEAEVELLRRREREGTLTREQIELAAYCGHEAARVVLGDRYVGCMHNESNPRCSCAYWGHACGGCSDCDGDDFVCLDHDLDKWLRGLGRWPGAVEQADDALSELVVGESTRGSMSVLSIRSLLHWARTVAKVLGVGKDTARQAIREALIERALGGGA